MKVFAECMSCMVHQVEKALRLLKPDVSERDIVLAQQEIMKVIAEADIDNGNNVELGAETYRIVGNYLGVSDPYKELKVKYNKMAMALYPAVKELVKNSADPFATAVKASIMGNAIDFGASGHIDIEKELEDLENNDLGGPNNLKSFLDAIKSAKKILILGDNTGEIVFDRILIEELIAMFPEKDFKYSVRGGPIINDSTMEDAIEVGMVNVCKVVEASPTPGIVISKSSEEFLKVFHDADLILSKGQGNFEAVIDIPTDWAKTIFLLKAKCRLMATIFSVSQGTLLLVEKKEDLVNIVSNKTYNKINIP